MVGVRRYSAGLRWAGGLVSTQTRQKVTATIFPKEACALLVFAYCYTWEKVLLWPLDLLNFNFTTITLQHGMSYLSLFEHNRT